MDQDLTFLPWEGVPGRRRSSPSQRGALLGSPLVLKYPTQPASVFHSSLQRELPVVDLEPEARPLSSHRTPLSTFLSPLSLLDSVHLNSIFHQDRLQSSFERSCASEPPPTHLIEDEEALSPLDWTRGSTSLLASPFSEESDSDDGLAPSPFSSPESCSQLEPDEETGECLFFSPSAPGRGHGYHHFGQYPNLGLFHDQPDDASSSHSQPLSVPASIPDRRIPLSASPPFSSYGFEEGLRSPSLLPAALPGFNSVYYFDDISSAIPGSPRHRAVDLPALEDGIYSKTNRFGLGLHSTDPSYPFGDFHFGDEVPPPSGISQRTTWLSLPGADTDDDLIPAELGSKTYIPDPSITVLTTPTSRSLLIWDPTTRSGLPAGLPSFDGTGHTTHRFDVDALSMGRPQSPEEDFDVDPALLAKLAENDAEVQKLCELKQRTNIAAVATYKSREGVQLDVERTREKWREVTALLRLKLTSGEEEAKVVDGASGRAASGGVEDGGNSLSSTPLLGASSLSSCITSVSLQPTSTSTSEELPESSSNPSTPDCSIASSSTSPQIRRRASKPKITSMAQLVANMVFHRQQDALRRLPIRSRTCPLVTSTTHTSTASGRTKSWTQPSPTSPLRQMILPEDLDGDSDTDGDIKYDTKDCVFDSPLQLSPLCLSLCRSPESFYAQLETTTSVPFSTS